jgi:hypothetical protein
VVLAFLQVTNSPVEVDDDEVDEDGHDVDLDTDFTCAELLEAP